MLVYVHKNTINSHNFSKKRLINISHWSSQQSHKMNSITLTLTGNSSSLNANFYPEIELDQRYSYSCALLDFHTYHSIPNVHTKNNKFCYSYVDGGTTFEHGFEIPVGSYEMEEIAAVINEHFESQDFYFRMSGNKNQMKTIIKCGIKLTFYFNRKDSIGSLLGFESITYDDTDYLISENVIDISHINTLKIDCDLISGSYHNGRNTHTIYEFSPDVDPGHKIVEQPMNLIYLPVIRTRINTLNITIVDQDNEFVDFRGERITCRLHIKRDN